MIVRVLKSKRVICEAREPLPLSARRVWGQLRDFHRFAGYDHFHAGIAIEGGVPHQRARLLIEHRYGPFRVRRTGRILQWREASGFAYSDLSLRGPRRGFPHVMSMHVVENTPDASTLIVRVTGRWTLPWPRWIAWLWLQWVMLSIVTRARNQLLAF